MHVYGFRFLHMALATVGVLFFLGCSDSSSGNNTDNSKNSVDMGGEVEAGECGNGVVEDGEVCDDGNRYSSDYCSWNCQEIIGYCGDRITQSNEDCEVDDEPEPCSEDDRVCRECVDCKIVEVDNQGAPRCGDGVVQREAGEQCENATKPENVFPGDDGSGSSNLDLTRSCIDCRWVVHNCGNGELEPEKGEVCDSGWRVANRRIPPSVGECLNNCMGYRRVEKLVLSESNTIALTNIARFYMWGSDRDGQLGNSGVARGVPGMHQVEQRGVNLDARAGMFCQPTVSEVFCWGAPFGLIFPAEHSNSGPYYIPSPEHYYSPGALLMTFSGESVLAVGNDSVYVMNEAGEVAYSDLAANIWRAHPTPIGTVALPAPAIALDAGEEHACAILTDGGVHCWGDLGEMLQEPLVAAASSPVEIVAAHGAMSIYAGSGATLFVGAQGELGGVGANDFGQLDWAGVRDPAYVSFHHEHACVITSSGEVVCKGRNDHGQLGGSPGQNSHTITEFTDAIQVEVGVDHTCALTADGEVWCWGSNEDGKLGIGQEDGLDHPPTRITGWVEEWTPATAPAERVSTSGLCTDDDDCPAGLCLRTSETAGICVLRVSGAKSCYSGGGGYIPLPSLELGTCVPACSEDSDCGGVAKCIDGGAGNICLVFPPPTEHLGDPCEQDADCGASSCYEDIDGMTPGGYCSRDCRQLPCGEQEICGDVGFNEQDLDICLERCAEDSECREGYECRAIWNVASNVCVASSWLTLPPE